MLFSPGARSISTFVLQQKNPTKTQAHTLACLWFITVPPSPETLTTLGFAYTGKRGHVMKRAPHADRGKGPESTIPLPGGLAPWAHCPPSHAFSLMTLEAGLTCPFPWELHFS